MRSRRPGRSQRPPGTPRPAPAWPCRARTNQPWQRSGCQSAVRCGLGMATPLCTTRTRSRGHPQLPAEKIGHGPGGRDGAPDPASDERVSHAGGCRRTRPADGHAGGRPSPTGRRRCQEHHERSSRPGSSSRPRVRPPGQPVDPGHGRCRAPARPAAWRRRRSRGDPLLDRTCAVRSRLQGLPALETGAGPTMVTSGPPGRPASSSARLTVRSTGPPLSWVSRKTTFTTCRRARRDRRLIASSGPRTLRPPPTAARKVASEKSSTKLRGMRSGCVPGRHQPGRVVTAEVKPAAATAATTGR